MPLNNDTKRRRCRLKYWMFCRAITRLSNLIDKILEV